MNEKQMENYPKHPVKYGLEMTSEEFVSFKKELDYFLKEKLGQRAYVCIIAYQIKAGANDQLYQPDSVGLDNPVSMWHTINCIKAVNQQVAGISQMMAAPLQPITPENNPLVQQQKKVDENPK